MIDEAVDVARTLLREANTYLTWKQKRHNKLFSHLMKDAKGKAFLTKLTDTAFRSSNPQRVIRYIQQLLYRFGVPRFLPWYLRFLFYLFRYTAHYYPSFALGILQQALRKKTQTVILPGEEELLKKHLQKRSKEGVIVNLNRLGEAILGEEEATKRLETYLQDLQNPLIPVISIKISSIYSQINLIAYDSTKEELKKRLRILYKACKNETPYKLINLDMEEYRDLRLTCDVFESVLSEPEFVDLTAGVALQSYIPDSFEYQKRLTEFAKKRMQNGGAPLRIRLVKGANLGMETVEASIKGWNKAPYDEKKNTDANFKKMLHYAIENLQHVHIGIASHNLFDIAYGIVLCKKHNAKRYISFEMLEGMAPHLRKAVIKHTGHVLLYCPTAKKEDFHTAMAYLMRRLDENTHKDNFLPHVFDMTFNTPAWQMQEKNFRDSFSVEVTNTPRRFADREKRTFNQPDIDWCLEDNQKWIHSIQLPHITTPSLDVHTALSNAKSSNWGKITIDERIVRFRHFANLLRKHRGELIQCIVHHVHKSIYEADGEVSEAIDFAEYYADVFQKHPSSVEEGAVAVVATPWNFPLSIPISGIIATLAAGYNVIFKPAPEAIEVGRYLTELLTQADLSVQFVVCDDEPDGSFLISHPLVKAVVLTGSTQTARQFMKMHPTVKLFAETGGKNSIIVSALADRDLAVRDIIQSAFGYSGQKCSACSLVICEEEVYSDPLFLSQLKDAATSLIVGQSRNPAAKITPLIRTPGADLLRALTTLEPGESWLVEPKKITETLWSPGIKLGVQRNSFTHQTELFGPVLAIMKAKDLSEAIDIANEVPYGLTSGLHSLDEEEHTFWIERIQAGNLYINRGITGAIVARQPFGGCKASSFGIGMKAGGENYLLQFFTTHQGSDSYEYWWKHYFSKKHTLTNLIGQENILFFKPHKKIFLFVQQGDAEDDIQRIQQAAAITGTKLCIFSDFNDLNRQISQEPCCRIRCLQTPPAEYAKHFAEVASCIDISRPSPHGRYELLHFVHEVCISYDYHRYGNISFPTV